MTLFIDESMTAKGWTPADQVPFVPGWGGRQRTIESITIHWWGAYGQTHDGVLAFFCTTGPGTTSAHFVCSPGRTNCIVSPVDAAWHAGNPLGNCTSIGVECQPEGSDECYQQVAELIAWLRDTYRPADGRDLPLIPHRHWQATDCPGNYDLDRLDRMAREITQPAPIPAPAPTPTRTEDKMLVITQAQGDTAVWIGDGVTRRWIPDPKTLDDYRKLHSWGLLNIFKGGEVQTVPPETIGADVIGATAGKVLAGLPPAQIAGLVPADVAKAVLDALAARLAA